MIGGATANPIDRIAASRIGAERFVALRERVPPLGATPTPGVSAT